MTGKNDSMKGEKSEEEGAFSTPLLAKQEDTEIGRSNTAVNGPNREVPTHKNQSDGEREMVCLNIGGKKFYVLQHNFDRFPNTRLGHLVQANSKSKILEYCDRYTDGEVPEFFFDRSWKGFNDILDVYRLGRLHLNSGGYCAMRTQALMEYWQIDELLLDPCCALKYYPEIETCSTEIEGEKETERKYQERLVAEDFGGSPVGKIRKYLWNLTEYPETSIAARITAFTSMSVVVISTVTFVLSTMPELTDDLDLAIDNITAEEAQIARVDGIAVDRWHMGILIIKVIDQLTMWFFTLEYAIRIICSPNKWEFFKAPLNLVDLMAILPYFISFAMEEMKDTLAIGRAGKVLRLIRVMRILRVFKLVRHFNGLQSLLSTLKQAYKELGLLMVLVSVTVLTFSSLIYFAEKDSDSNWTFFESFWWGLMALTTVGYGDRAPSSAVGKTIGGFCALIGIFILALPVPIVVNSFSTNYKNRIWKTEVMMRKQEREDGGRKDGGITMIEMQQGKRDPEMASNGEDLRMPKKSNGQAANATVESFVNIE